MSFQPEMNRRYINSDGTATQEGLLMLLAIQECLDLKVSTDDLETLIDQRLQALGLIP